MSHLRLLSERERTAVAKLREYCMMSDQAMRERCHSIGSLMHGRRLVTKKCK